MRRHVSIVHTSIMHICEVQFRFVEVVLNLMEAQMQPERLQQSPQLGKQLKQRYDKYK